MAALLNRDIHGCYKVHGCCKALMRCVALCFEWYMVGLVKVKNGQQKDTTHDEILLHVDKYNLDSWFSKCRNHYRLIRMVYVNVWRDIESVSFWPLITFTWSPLQIWNLTWQSLMWFAISNHKRQFLVQFNNQRTPPLQSYES